MRKIVAHTTVPTGRGVNGALKARIGGLKPHTEYYYVWESGTNVSPIGRTRTAPPPGAAQPLNFGVSSCQNYGVGYFNAHARRRGRPRHGPLPVPRGLHLRARPRARTRCAATTSHAVDLATYRAKYALYRSDPGLRELHRIHPIAHIWDDHEVENNYSDNNPAPALAQRYAGYRAAFEWLPRMSFPKDRHRIYRQLSFGALADVFMHRPAPVPHGQQRRAGAAHPRRRADELADLVAEGLDGDMEDHRQRGRDRVHRLRRLPQPATRGTATAADRAQLLGEIERAGIDNVVFLTGDAHVFMCSLLASDFSTFGDGTRAQARGRRVRHRLGHVASARTSPSRRSSRRRHGTASTTAPTTATGASRIGPDQLVMDYMASDIVNPGGATALLEHFTQPAGDEHASRASRTSPPRLRRG